VGKFRLATKEPEVDAPHQARLIMRDLRRRAVTKKVLNRSLHAAKATKQDEFYTQLSDIEKELRHYGKHFKGRTVLCNCDDPKVSNFFHSRPTRARNWHNPPEFLRESAAQGSNEFKDLGVAAAI
jgi:hypothetical protein